MQTTARNNQCMVWIVIAVAISSVMAFTGGYLVGAITAGEDEGILLVDDYGRTIKLDKVPERIVSTAPTPTEMLFAVGAGDQVVGVDDYSDYPAEVANITKVGSYTLSTEVIISLQPDLVVSSDSITSPDFGISWRTNGLRSAHPGSRRTYSVGTIKGGEVESRTLRGKRTERRARTPGRPRLHAL